MLNWKKERSQKENLTLHLKELEEKQPMSKISQKKKKKKKNRNKWNRG